MKEYVLSVAMFDGCSLVETLRQTAAAGFDAIEVSGSAEYLAAWTEDVAQTRRLLAEAGITVRVLHSPSEGWNNDDPDDAARQRSIALTVASFRQAAELGAEFVICHANKPSHPFTREDWAANWERSCESLGVLAEEARAAGVKMAVENLPVRGEPRPTGSIAQVLEMISGLGDHVGVCLDAGHSNANGLSAAEEALQAGSKLFALHIQDNDGCGEDQHLLPGQGTTDWPAFLRALDMLAFAGPRTFEVGKGNTLAEQLAALAALREAWS